VKRRESYGRRKKTIQTEHNVHAKHTNRKKYKTIVIKSIQKRVIWKDKT
jgi:hypothetical protein